MVRNDKKTEELSGIIKYDEEGNGVLEPTEEELQHWNSVLATEKLSVDKGRSTKVIYVGGIKELELISGHQKDDSGRVAPKKAAQ